LSVQLGDAPKNSAADPDDREDSQQLFASLYEQLRRIAQ